MKKIVNLLLFASCLMLMNNIKIQNNVDFYESTNDILDKDIEELIQKRADAFFSKICFFSNKVGYLLILHD